MTRQQIIDFTGDSLLRRTDIDTQLLDALKMAHLQIQRDGDFQCMEATSADLPYVSTDTQGIALPAGYKSMRYVTLVETDAGVESETPIDSGSEGTEQANQQAIIDHASADVTVSTRLRWYLRGQKLMLNILPDATDPKTLRLYHYKYLDFYAAAGSEDWFSQYAWDALAAGCAWLACVYLWEDDRAARFEAQYRKALAAALAADRKAKLGPVATVYRPPLRQAGRVR